MNAVSPKLPRNAATPASFSAQIRAAEAASNPLLEAARPLLDALPNTPAGLDTTGIARHRQWLLHQIRTFGKVCAALDLPATQVDKARYCLCSALDEAAALTDWGNGTTIGMEWGTNGLATTFGYDRQGGDRVYAIATECMHQPHDNHNLIEVILHILEHGFRGRYRFTTDGAHQIKAVREQIHNALAAGSQSLPMEHENPRATGSSPPLQRLLTDLRAESTPPESRRRLPIVALGLFLLAVAGCAAYWHFTQVKAAGQVTIPIDALAMRLTGRLSNEVNAGTIALAENAGHTTLTLRLEGIFEAGESTVNPWVKPMITTIGHEIAKVPGHVVVTGHTDNQPIAQSQHSSNLVLSDSRAQEVVEILISAGVPTDRVTATGKGNAEPAADNRTPQGRQKNRRVEITVSE
ncbi:DotU family type IV/VI secretion system protein [Trinickia violacea]|uniref:DotU family type IV/VI secretion system protein n=1 Tax=Trinickia violacea TaxID=2571746 RepID=A0A4P8IY88_9BURK|nr:type IVB secretion system protein IcmH/DotU [Trinickia violacea]QCP54388.1 DotU family type IV/VI secretion system protein [Trinickia violacea]